MIWLAWVLGSAAFVLLFWFGRRALLPRRALHRRQHHAAPRLPAEPPLSAAAGWQEARVAVGVQRPLRSGSFSSSCSSRPTVPPTTRSAGWAFRPPSSWRLGWWGSHLVSSSRSPCGCGASGRPAPIFRRRVARLRPPPSRARHRFVQVIIGLLALPFTGPMILPRVDDVQPGHAGRLPGARR